MFPLLNTVSSSTKDGFLISCFIDVCNESDIKDAHEVVKKHVGDLGLNVLINNAGILTGERKIEDVTSSVMMETFRTNVVGPTMLIKVYIRCGTCDHSYSTNIIPAVEAVRILV